MKITIELDSTIAEDATILDGIVAARTGNAPATAPPPAAKPAKPKKESATAKKKRLAAEAEAEELGRAALARAVEAEAKTAEAKADDIMDDGNAGEVTLDGLKAVVKATIERTDIDQVKAVFKDHEAGKISDLATESYADVKAALEAL